MMEQQIYTDQSKDFAMGLDFLRTWSNRVQCNQHKFFLSNKNHLRYQTCFWFEGRNGILEIDSRNRSINDPLFLTDISTLPIPNFGAGLWLHSKEFFAGISVSKILENERDDPNRDPLHGSIRRHYFLMAGYVLEINPALVFKPTALFRMEEHGLNSIDVSASFLMDKRIWGGISFRSNESLGINFSYIIDDSYRFGYAYDMQIGGLSSVNSGSHEIMLGMDIKKRNKFMSPRYF